MGKNKRGQPDVLAFQDKGKGKGKAKVQGKAQAKVQAEKALEDDEENDFDLMEEDGDEDDNEELDFGDDDELFWNLTVKPDEDVMLEQPPNPASIICVTHACFGEQVTKGSRTILYCSTPALEEPTPICILTEGSHESHPLNLKFGSPASFVLKGRQPSTVYLSGYLQSDLPPMMDDDISENDLDVEEDEPQFHSHSRKRGAPEEDILSQEPTTKKRKIELPKKAVEIKKTPEANKPKVATKTPQQPPQQPPVVQSTPTNNEQTSTPETKTLSKKQAKKQKKLLQQQGKNDDKSKDDEKKEEPATPSTITETPQKTDNKEEKTTSQEEPKSDTKSQKQNANTSDVKILPNGIGIKDIKVGTGATVQQGQTLYLHFVGQLEDKTVFEKHLTGTGREFKLGSQDGIQGWNLGIKGMKIGGKRRITIPPKFAFGEKGNEEKKIPANATVTFTVEVKEAK